MAHLQFNPSHLQAVRKILQQHYDVPLITSTEAEAEVANLIRKHYKGSLDYKSGHLMARLKVCGAIKEI